MLNFFILKEILNMLRAISLSLTSSLTWRMAGQILFLEKVIQFLFLWMTLFVLSFHPLHPENQLVLASKHIREVLMYVSRVHISQPGQLLAEPIRLTLLWGDHPQEACSMIRVNSSTTTTTISSTADKYIIFFNIIFRYSFLAIEVLQERDDPFFFQSKRRKQNASRIIDR